MRNEKQVPILDLCKRLKELGYPQEGLWWWVKMPGGWVLLDHKAQGGYEQYVAPTVAELGEALPAFHLTYKSDYKHEDGSSPWIPKITNGTHIENVHFGDAKTEADARAKMLIYLYENKLIGEKK